ncbi:MAG: hypothetical protein ACXVJB_01980 [Mucilaginibacter sp.]
MKQALIYSLKVWLTSAFIGPFLLVGCEVAETGHANSDLVSFTFAIMVFGTFYSIPCFLILLFLVWILGKFKLSIIAKKAIASCVSILMVVLLTKAVFPATQDHTLVIIYSAVTVAGIWFYKIGAIPEGTPEIIEQD